MIDINFNGSDSTVSPFVLEYGGELGFNEYDLLPTLYGYVERERSMDGWNGLAGLMTAYRQTVHLLRKELDEDRRKNLCFVRDLLAGMVLQTEYGNGHPHGDLELDKAMFAYEAGDYLLQHGDMLDFRNLKTNIGLKGWR